MPEFQYAIDCYLRNMRDEPQTTRLFKTEQEAGDAASKPEFNGYFGLIELYRWIGPDAPNYRWGEPIEILKDE